MNWIFFLCFRNMCIMIDFLIESITFRHQIRSKKLFQHPYRRNGTVLTISSLQGLLILYSRRQ